MDINSTVLTANGASEVMTINKSQKIGVFVGGSLGGGSVQPQVKAGSAWADLGSPISAIGVTVLEVPPCSFRLSLSGATTPAVNLEVTR